MADKKVKELPEFFTEYCSEPYNRHNYEVHLTDGTKIPFADYMELRSFWFNHYQRDILSHVEIVDRPQKKGRKKGF